MVLNKRTGTFSVSSLESSPTPKGPTTHTDSTIGWTAAVSPQTSGGREAAPSVPELGEETWMTDPFYKWGNPRPERPPPAGLAVE